MGLYKRGKVWWMSFTYQGRQIRQSTETSNKKEAEQIYHVILGKIAENKWVERESGEDKTFAELADYYEEGPFKESRSWPKVYRYLLQLKDFFGPYPLARITPALIDTFKQQRRRQGVKGATINRQLTILRRMLNLAKKRLMWVKEVPSVEMEPNADVKRTRYLSFEEYHKLLDCCEEWLKPIVIVAAWTGLRQGNLLHLRRDQVNLFVRTIMIEGDETENREPLIIPIATPAFEVLKAAMKVSRLQSPYVFCREDGRPYYQQMVFKHFRKTLKRAGTQNFRFHDLRHCFASWNRQAGVDLDTLADLMGHKDTRMTRRYAHITPAHLSAALERVEQHYQQEFITVLSQSKGQA
ncbi:MAG: site-specific integrase [Candidatus Tectomicrobia bacterium]|nr:site-specific integrase [Candidatus Tectomicrobia bacterium]